ncbi:MAG: cation:dicarboxylase symporter family transporter, partial [Bacteroidales bacterium]
GQETLKNTLFDFREIVNKTISGVIIPLLPVFIFGIFLKMTYEGQVAQVLGVFLKIILLIFVLTIILLLVQFFIAGAVGRQNPFKLLKTMLTAYVTALGTQSSAATIPVTLQQAVKCGVTPKVAGSVIPLCATVHLAGSMLKITACAMAVMIMLNVPYSLTQFTGFIFLLGITMVAAPGVPGGAIMAAIGVLQSVLGFGTEAIGLMVALYIAMDSFGTACNVTGDGAIAVIVDKIYA